MRSMTMIVLLVMGCAGASKAGPAAPLRPGTTGFPGLDWGAPAEAVKAAYPGAAADPEGLAWRGEHEGRPAVVRFAIEDGALVRVTVAYDGTFASMMACKAEFAPMRARLDQRFGPSAEENLAAFWDTETASITLSCDMNEDETARLSVYYGPRAAE